MLYGKNAEAWSPPLMQVTLSHLIASEGLESSLLWGLVKSYDQVPLNQHLKLIFEV